MRGLLILLVSIVLGAMLFVAATVPLSDWQQAIFAAVVFLFALYLAKRGDRWDGRWVPLVLILISIFASTRYMYWRLTDSLIYENPLQALLAAGLVLAEVYAFVILLLGYFQVAWPLGRRPTRLPRDTSQWPTVDVFIPTYDEPLDVLKPTILGAMSMDWPRGKLNIYVLDDGRREELRRFCVQAGVHYLTRPDNKHAKAGNLNAALARTDGEFVAIFDADHIPTRTFLKVTMGGFLRDDKLAVVQTPHHFYSPDPFERNLGIFRKVPNEGELFYGLVQDGNDFWGAAYFCGSCAVIRRKALEEIGGIATDTLTEDAHTALLLHAKGWRSAYIRIAQAAGLAPESVSALVGQRQRWARGMVQVLRKDNPLFKRGLSIGQRLCYFNAMIHFFYGLPRIVFLTAPLAYLLFGAHIIATSALTLAAYVLPHLTHAILANARIQGKHRHSFWAEVYESALSPFLVWPALKALFAPDTGKFKVTKKGFTINQNSFDYSVSRPLWIMLVLNLIGIGFGVVRLLWWNPDDLDTVIINLAWTFYNIIILGAAIAVCWEAKQVRKHHRVDVKFPAMLRLSNGKTVHCFTRDVSEGGVSLTLPVPMTVPVGDAVSITLLPEERELVLAAKVVATPGRQVNLSFHDLSLEQYRQLTEMVFCRPNAWVHWADERFPDHPLFALRQVAAKGRVGIIKTIQALAPRMGQWLASRWATVGKAAAIIAMLGCSTVVTAAEAPAEVGGTPTSVSQDPRVETRTYTLKQLGAFRPIRLQGVDGRGDVYLGVRDDEVVLSAVLHLEYRHSPSLIAHLSHLNVLINGNAVASLPLNKQKGAIATADVRVDPRLLDEYNTITFQMIGHYKKDGCEYPYHTSLWSVINNTSTLEMQVRKLKVREDLALLPFPFFDKHDVSKLQLPIVFARDAGLAEIKAAGVVAGWFAIKADYRGAGFPVWSGKLPLRGNAVVVAVAGNSLPGLIMPDDIDGPTLAMVPHPSDPAGHLLLVTGRDGGEVQQAAMALALGRVVLNGSRTTIDRLQIPEPLAPYQAPRWLPMDRKVTFSEIVDRERLQVSGLFPPLIVVPFRTAPDLFGWDKESAALHLHYRFTPPKRDGDSALNVSLNGNFLGSLPLVHEEKYAPQMGWWDKLVVTLREWIWGVKVEHEADFDIPAYWFGNYNELGFQFHFDPNSYLESAECKEQRLEHLVGAVAANSTIDLSGIPHYTRMPNAALFVNGGYPFSRHADLANTAVILPSDLREDAISAFLTIMGMIANNVGYPPVHVRVAQPGDLESMTDVDLLVIGDVETNPVYTRWVDAMPLQIRGVQVTYKRSGMLDRALSWFNGGEGVNKDAVQAVEMVASNKGQMGLIMGMESPMASGRSVVFLLGRGGMPLDQVANAVVDSTELKKAHGDVLLLAENGTVGGFRITSSYYVGDLPFWTWLRWQFSQHPILMLLLTLLSCIIISRILFLLLRRRAALRQRGGR